MEDFHAEDTPLAVYLEGQGIRDVDHDEHHTAKVPPQETQAVFAPPNQTSLQTAGRDRILQQLQLKIPQQGALSRVHTACSKAVNSRLGRVDNARFLEHFRYVIVASQLLNEYLDQPAFHPHITQPHGLDGAPPSTGDDSKVATNFTGAVVVATAAFALVWLMHWARTSRNGNISKSRVALALTAFIIVAVVAYAYFRRRWLSYLRQQAVEAASALTNNWHAFEVSSVSALSLIQEVELVSKGYRLSTPFPPVTRLDDQPALRRCTRLRKALHMAYSANIPAFAQAYATLYGLVDEDDLEKYFEVYDISTEDARDASGEDTSKVVEDDPESLKALRMLSYRANVLRRVTLCTLLALQADGGRPDLSRWRLATDVMERLGKATAASAERLRHLLSEMEHFERPKTPVKTHLTPAKERLRLQVRKISSLSSGIRGLQAKMQILREESNKSIEQTDDLTDVGPSIMAQYESVGQDLRELMQAWETGKASLATNITKHERRISMASCSIRSPFSSLGGPTAVEEGSPSDALRALNGDKSVSNRSSIATTPSDEEVFEAIALPRQRSTLTREERLIKMQEERTRQALLREKRESNTSMLKELESVINLRPKKTGPARIMSL